MSISNGSSQTLSLQAGAADVDITPAPGAFLYGYPHAERVSTAVNDPLLITSLYLNDGATSVLFLSTDLIWVPTELCNRVRQKIDAALGIPATHVMVSATHTHSGPVTSRMISNESDPVVPFPDEAYLAELESNLVAAAAAATEQAKPAHVYIAMADASGLGTNRRHPDGPSLPDVPVIAVKSAARGDWIALMAICAMHPTVLHQDSTVISGDFPGFTRMHLKDALGPDIHFLYQQGASGNQSPRHVTRSNTIAETKRLGELLGHAIMRSLSEVQIIDPPQFRCISRRIHLPLRDLPEVYEATRYVSEMRQRLDVLRREGAETADIRTAECDWFGAEETHTLAKAAANGRLSAAADLCMPAEVQLIRIGAVCLAGWPGEVFVEFALEVMAGYPNAHVITLANGELQGYLVTEQAVREGGYEASNAIFRSPDSGHILVDTTIELLQEIGAGKGCKA